MKRIVAATLAALMAVSLTACKWGKAPHRGKGKAMDQVEYVQPDGRAQMPTL